MNTQFTARTLVRSTSLALAGIAVSATLGASPASAMACMVDCWNEDGGWSGGGGLSGGSAGTGGGSTGTGVGGGGGDGGRYSDPSGTGWGNTHDSQWSTPNDGNGTVGGSGSDSCGGADVYDDYAVITGCAPNPDAGPVVPPPPEESGAQCRERVREDVVACKARSEVVCAAMIAGGGKYGGRFKALVGVGSGVACKITYHYICNAHAREAENCP